MTRPERWQYMSRRARVWWWVCSCCWLPYVSGVLGVGLGCWVGDKL